MSKCFVPNCGNTSGISFPKEPDLKIKWLESLQIGHLTPTLSSFVCLDHFDEKDLNQESQTGARITCRLKKGAIPTISKKSEIKTNPEENQEQTMTGEDSSEDIKICRLCLSDKNVNKHILDNYNENEVILDIINECLSPLKITRDDDGSQVICASCFVSLQDVKTFRTMCFEMQAYVAKDPIPCQEETVPKRRKSEEDVDEGNHSKKVCYDKDVETLKESIEDEDHTKKQQMPSPLPLATVEATPTTNSKKDIDAKFDRVEEELRKVLEGHLSQEQIAAENIIIAVEDDDENNQTRKASVTKIKLPIVIKPVDKTTQERRTIIDGDKVRIPPPKSTQKINLKEGSLLLPNGIRVTVPDRFTSSVGLYHVVNKPYVFDSNFAIIDGYLFDYRLSKGNMRQMRCVLPACHSMAIQTRTETGEYSEEGKIKVAHNHKRPSEQEIKKQMFYYVMKRVMQNDRSMNFKTVYDQVCEIDPEIRTLVPMKNVINEICKHQMAFSAPQITSFDEFYNTIENDSFQKLHFTFSGKQFYQEKFSAEDDSKAIIFANCEIIDQISYSKLMYVDASFRIKTADDFNYQLVTILVWMEESYYPILFALVNNTTQEIYKKIFEYLHDTLAPNLKPDEIVTDYEANLYYALGETYLDSHIGGSVFYYTQNLYKKICALNLSRDLETNSYFRNIYHMLLMLPLLPVNTILDGLNNIEIQAADLGLQNLTTCLFEHVRSQWILKVTPDLFCVHRLENRINENVIAPFKKLRDFLMLSKGKMSKQNSSIVTVVEKLIELESFLQVTYATPNKKTFARDLSSSQKKNVLKAWQFIENHPKININNFFTKVLGYIKCMENQLWIWGFYRYQGDVADDLINATNFSIVSNDIEIQQTDDMEQQEVEEEEDAEFADSENSVVMEAVIDENGGFVLQEETDSEQTQFDNTFLKYVYKE